MRARTPERRNLFPSGDLYFGREGEVAEEAAAGKASGRVVIVHNNWIKGKRLKVDRFCRAGKLG
jgi:hypothetical protein